MGTESKGLWGRIKNVASKVWNGAKKAGKWVYDNGGRVVDGIKKVGEVTGNKHIQRAANVGQQGMNVVKHVGDGNYADADKGGKKMIKG
jgi:hypothetical protein